MIKERNMLGVFFGERFFLFGDFFFSNWGINVFENLVLLNLEKFFSGIIHSFLNKTLFEDRI